jgi:hypothetical protein
MLKLVVTAEDTTKLSELVAPGVIDQAATRLLLTINLRKIVLQECCREASETICPAVTITSLWTLKGLLVGREGFLEVNQSEVVEWLSTTLKKWDSIQIMGLNSLLSLVEIGLQHLLCNTLESGLTRRRCKSKLLPFLLLEGPGLDRDRTTSNTSPLLLLKSPCLAVLRSLFTNSVINVISSMEPWLKASPSTEVTTLTWFPSTIRERWMPTDTTSTVRGRTTLVTGNKSSPWATNTFSMTGDWFKISTLSWKCTLLLMVKSTTLLLLRRDKALLNRAPNTGEEVSLMEEEIVTALLLKLYPQSAVLNLTSQWLRLAFLRTPATRDSIGLVVKWAHPIDKMLEVVLSNVL